MCWLLFCLCRPFCTLVRCLDSNPESCRSKQALPTMPPISLLSNPFYCIIFVLILLVWLQLGVSTLYIRIYSYILHRGPLSLIAVAHAASLLMGSSGWDSNQGPFLRQTNAYYYLSTLHPQALPKLRYATPLSNGCGRYQFWRFAQVLSI